MRAILINMRINLLLVTKRLEHGLARFGVQGANQVFWYKVGGNMLFSNLGLLPLEVVCCSARRALTTPTSGPSCAPLPTTCGWSSTVSREFAAIRCHLLPQQARWAALCSADPRGSER